MRKRYYVNVICFRSGHPGQVLNNVKICSEKRKFKCAQNLEENNFKKFMKILYRKGNSKA